ncbi:MAG: segregation/condensation protein A [Alphaproteobacteria bacterium]|nr:segregation/condensation protein A [Alphaproteobacteria bacterium]
MVTDEGFGLETDFQPPPNEGGLVVELGAYEGPLDVLLALAREQKVDLTKISILRLAEQYLAFIAAARDLRLEVAADYLVMAAWLAYLKSRLLLPPPDDDGEQPTGAEMAAALAFQLRRLESMRNAGAALFERPHLGRDVFPRGEPESFPVLRSSVYDASLFELLKSYSLQQRRTTGGTYSISDPVILFSIEEALVRLTEKLDSMPDWATLSSYLPKGLADPLTRRSAVAATFGASLELAKSGHVQLRQDKLFGPIFVRAKRTST